MDSKTKMWKTKKENNLPLLKIPLLVVFLNVLFENLPIDQKFSSVLVCVEMKKRRKKNLSGFVLHGRGKKQQERLPWKSGATFLNISPVYWKSLPLCGCSLLFDSWCEQIVLCPQARSLWKQITHDNKKENLPRKIEARLKGCFFFFIVNLFSQVLFRPFNRKKVDELLHVLIKKNDSREEKLTGSLLLNVCMPFSICERHQMNIISWPYMCFLK